MATACTSMPEHLRKIHENSCIYEHGLFNFFLHCCVSFQGKMVSKIMEEFYKLVWTASI